MIFANGQRVQFPGPTKVKSGTEGADHLLRETNTFTARGNILNDYNIL